MNKKSKSAKSTWNSRDWIVIIILTLIFILFALHYYPNQIGRSIRETIANIFWFSGFSGVITWILVKVLTRLEKARPPWPKIIKIFLALAIAFGSIHQFEGCLKAFRSFEKDQNQKPISSLYHSIDINKKCSG